MKITIIHLLIVGAFLYLFENLFPTSHFSVQLAGAFMVNALYHDLTTEKRLARFTAPFRFIWEWMTQRYLNSPSRSKLQCLKHHMHRWIIPNDGISSAFIESLSVKSSAALVLSLQGEEFVRQKSPLTFVDFKSAARKAAQWSAYRLFLLRQSTLDFPNVSNIIEKLDEPSNYTIGDDLKSISDHDFFRRLQKSSDEVVHIFTTTSQLSSDFIQSLTAYSKNISKLHFYICSPLVLSDAALLELTDEYRNPSFTMKQGQFVMGTDGKVSVEGDMLRRVIKILGALRQLSSINADFDISIHFFTTRYPGLKLRLLEKEKYAQIQPGPLTFANNLYRFGIDISHSEYFNILKDDLYAFLESSKVSSQPLASIDIEALTSSVTREMCEWLCSRGKFDKEVLNMKSGIKSIAKDPIADQLLENSAFLLQRALNSIRGGHEICELRSDSAPPLHISVGLVIEREDQILLIKKSDTFYGKKYSIVAGHLNQHETPEEAICREVREELGVSIYKPQLLGRVIELEDSCRHGGSRHIWFTFTATVDFSQIKPDPSEIEELEWVPRKKLQDFSRHLTPGAHGVLCSLGYISEKDSN